jgi:transcriptional regulator of heat shock response
MNPLQDFSEGLTARQTQILKALIDEYIDTAYPVGSGALEKKYDLGVSPATIRNEMASLTQTGFLRQPHTSAGRVPSPKAMRFYIDQLMEEKKMSLTDEVKAKEEVWDARGDIESLLAEAIQSLADRTQNLAVGVTQKGYTIHAGLSNVFTNPEFANVEVCSNIFSLIEEVQGLQDVFFKSLTGDEIVQVLFGEELSFPHLEPVGIVATQVRLGDQIAAIGVIGPTRISPSVIPMMQYYSRMLQEVFGA